MTKVLSYKLILFLLVSMVMFGCQDWNPIDGFDKGHTEREFDGDPQVGFFPLSQEVSEAAGATSVEIQLIAEQRDSDLQVDFSVDGESTAVEGEHFEFASSSPATISANSSTVDVGIELISGNVEGEVALILSLDGASGDVEPAPNFSSATVFISEAEEE